jgi:hypothetical protein
MKKVIVQCPKCGFRNRGEGGDDLHTHYSTEKPDKSTVVDGDIQEGEPIDCRNAKCRHPIIVYWFYQQPFFERV